MNFAKFKALTRLEQTLFALPFLLTSVLLALAARDFKWSGNFTFLWMFPAFLSARISGMCFNQLLDWKFDAQNPRTKNRPLPKGDVSPQTALKVALTALGSFILCCLPLGHKIVLLSLLAAFLIVLYSFMKRFHATCHLVIGFIHFLSPLMAWIVIFDKITLTPLFLGAAACFAIIGSDITYAMQDRDFDVQKGLHSIPAKLGMKKAFILAAIMHFLCVIFSVLVGVVAQLGLIYYLAPLVLSLFFLYFYTRKKRDERLFYLCSVLISFSMLTFTTLDQIWRALL